MPRPTFQQACAMYINRFTMDHVPPWSQRSFRQQGGTIDLFPAPQFASDQQWYDNTLFPTEEGHHGDPNHCYTRNPTWPLGQRLSAPYSSSSPVKQVTQAQIRAYYKRLLREGYTDRNARERCLSVKFGHLDGNVVLDAMNNSPVKQRKSKG